MSNFDQKIIKKMASLFESFGVNPIMGRILGVLLVSQEPQSLVVLADTLDLSKAAISIQIRLLEDLGYCEKLPRKKDRQHYYQLREDYLETAYRRRIDKEKFFLQEMQDLLEESPDPDAISERRLKHFIDFSQLMVGQSLDSLVKWKSMSQNVETNKS